MGGDGRDRPLVPRLPLAARLRGRPGFDAADRRERERFERALPATGDGYATVRRDGRLLAVRPDATATGRSVARANLDLVVGLCEREGIDYFAVPEPNSLTARIAIAPGRWDAFTRALARPAPDGPVYVEIAARTRNTRTRFAALSTDPWLDGALAGQDRLEVFRPVAPGPDSPLLGVEWACRVEPWTAGEDDRVLAADRNPRAAFVDAALATPATVDVLGRPVATLAPFTRRHVFEVDFPVDAVYLWVDGGDPAWQARKAAALSALAGAGDTVVEPGAVADERFRDGGELRYSLRSLAAYAPWVRRVFLVTDGQLPGWLDRDAAGLTLVDHRELFGDAGRLPTFNSHAIGARLHHIEGLAEHYLYLNDDVFFGRDVTPAAFFEAGGLSKFFLSRTSLGFADDTHRPAHESARRNVADLLERDFGRTPANIFYHSPVPQRRSTMAELERRYPDEFARTWSNQFRSHTDIEPNSWLHHYYGYLTGRAVPASISYTYAELGRPEARPRLTRLARTRDRDVFCINDHVDATPDDHAFAADWLARYFPVPSRFEKPS